MVRFAAVTLVLFLLVTVSLHAADKPVKVFILAGQSNMEGHAAVSTFDYIAGCPI